MDLGTSNLNSFHWEFLAPPLLAVAGRARRIHDRLAGYAPVSTVQSLVLAHRPLYPSSLRPPAASNVSIHKLRCAAARCSLHRFGVLVSRHAFCYSRAPRIHQRQFSGSQQNVPKSFLFLTGLCPRVWWGALMLPQTCHPSPPACRWLLVTGCTMHSCSHRHAEMAEDGGCGRLD